MDSVWVRSDQTYNNNRSDHVLELIDQAVHHDEHVSLTYTAVADDPHSVARWRSRA